MLKVGFTSSLSAAIYETQDWVFTTGLIPGEEEFVAGLQADIWGILSPSRLAAGRERREDDHTEGDEAETGNYVATSL